uniref:Secreted protein n=1 Tax=Solanum tuberosum TaxID=4113 RepID=M1B2Q3_SOLTU
MCTCSTAKHLLYSLLFLSNSVSVLCNTFVSKRYICSCSQFNGVYNCLLPQLVESTINLVFGTQILSDKKLAKK